MFIWIHDAQASNAITQYTYEPFLTTPMKMVLLTNIVSPHQLPLASALANRLGKENFRYIATEGEHTERTKLGWVLGEPPSWVIFPARSSAEEEEARYWCNNVTILLSGLRELALFRERAERGLMNFYIFERWFKPPIGFLRMFHPGFWQMARTFYDLQRNGSVVYLPMGIHAAEDMVRMSGFFDGNLSCLFRQPQLQMMANEPFAAFDSEEISFTRNGSNFMDYMRLWGYYVEPSDQPCQKWIGDDQLRVTQGKHCELTGGTCDTSNPDQDTLLRILWLGRMLDWKRVDTLIMAITRLLDEGYAIRMEVVGYGPEEEKLRRLAGQYLISDRQRSEHDGAFQTSANSRAVSSEASGQEPGIVFVEPVPIKQVRGLMRNSEIVVLSSDGGEGWGAVVNEAMAEGCCVIGTYEAGSSATLIEHGVNGWLYQAGNVTELVNLLRQCDKDLIRKIGDRARNTLDSIWSPVQAADRLLEFASEKIQPPISG